MAVMAVMVRTMSVKTVDMIMATTIAMLLRRTDGLDDHDVHGNDRRRRHDDQGKQ